MQFGLPGAFTLAAIALWAGFCAPAVAMNTSSGSSFGGVDNPAGKEDRAQAVTCLTQAIYYEAATEPLEGRESVAQVVLNRVRSPSFPKTVCGVVYQGVGGATGCQFTFACDGSMARRPEPRLWSEAQGIAEGVLDGRVLSVVGDATHYHAFYVAPAWRASMVETARIGAHLFYRRPDGGSPASPRSYEPRRGSYPRPTPTATTFSPWGLDVATIAPGGAVVPTGPRVAVAGAPDAPERRSLGDGSP